MYGDPEIHDLKAALAAHHGCRPQNIVVGEGIDGLLGYLVRLMVAEGDAVVTSRGAYPTFNFHVAGFGGQLQTAPYRDDFEDPQALLDLALRSHAKLLYIANPDNPMGSHHPAAVISDLLAQLPATTLIEAEAIGRRLCESVEQSPIGLGGAEALHVTISIGLAVSLAGQARPTVAQIIDHADRALLQAKSDGRNQVTIGRNAA